ncbi:hypothetical protein [Gorillibacterium sp. sgz5001074]|uniref:exo-rhamnogalacturonan lyase family protein n=1 Tax=Gorillibacterium sp. sgz5001074 TaxID=3446695 RepID=UPI003F67BB89
MEKDTVVRLRRLTPAAGRTAGTAWGIPWRKGELRREETLRLMLPGDKASLPLQSWPAAFWPDGSVKWSAHAAVLPGDADGVWTVEKAGTAGGARSDQAEACAGAVKDHEASVTAGESGSGRVSVTESQDAVLVDTGAIICEIGRTGNAVIRRIVRQGSELCSSSELVALREETSAVQGGRIVREERFAGVVKSAVVEQNGPVRAVVRVDGLHRAETGAREWLPYTLRLYFFARLDTVRLVHTFHFDGDPAADAIKGLGLRFRLPLQGPLYNRHVRMAGDDGFFSESPKTLHTRRTKGKYRELFERQSAGEAIGFDPSEDAYFLHLLDDSATWDGFKLVQASADHYRVSKRTGKDCCWLKVADGRRAGGLFYAGGSAGGLAAGMRSFWQKHPSGGEVTGMAGDEAELTLWFWSPEAGAMDLRHYDTRTHVESSYEGAEELRSTPYGIANTNEVMLWALAGTPSPEELRALLAESQEPALLVCEPEHYRGTGAFGVWSLPDRSTPAKAYVEEQLDGVIAFYQREVEQRRWYGFWDYGDFMHSYDPVRHVWNYDLGGCAWQNTELAPNMWLWLSFLRSGRADVFRLAEAMTRHTGEVDVYHFGEYAGLGSRHNVVHWGCGCKEARIAMAGLHRYYYYLTADERTGDLLDLVKDADYATVNLDPMRAYFPKDEHPAHIRVGPDWAAFSSNWMTRWERFEDTFYRDKILTGIDCIKKARYRLISGPTYGYDPSTGVLTPMGEDNYGRHLAVCMGGPQVWFELAELLDDPEWNDMMAELGVYFNLPQEEKDLLTKGEISHKSFEHPVLSGSIAAYGAYYRKDRRTAENCWRVLLDNPFGRVRLAEEEADVVHLEALKEIDWMNTNEAAQWSLNTIISLELIPDALPERQETSGGVKGG